MKKILFIYPSMMLGGSTTALLSLMNSLDPAKYQIDLQLQSNSGPLFGDIPAHVNVLPAAQKYTGAKGRILKPLKFIFQGAALKAWLVNLKNKKRGLSPDVVTDFFAKSLSRKNNVHYDHAIGFLEGWSNFYLAYHVDADNKYAWLHSTFANITSNPQTQLPWMKKVDKIVFVTDACAEAFRKTLPDMADKTIVIENITDSGIIRKRSERLDETDEAYIRYKNAGCFKLITVCRITISTKGLDRIVRCAKRLKEEGITFLWYIVGNGQDEERLKAMIAENGVEDCLVPIGVRFNPYPLIKEADVMCMPSRYEGKPIVITESMILGVPPVVTEYLSAHDQIKDSFDGIVVSNHDEAIVDAVLDCAKNMEKVNKMKECVRATEYGNREYISVVEAILFA